MGRSIALVDDDRNILTSVSMTLEAEGFDVRAFGDGAEALEGLLQRPADLVILDIKMPRMDGMEMLSRLRGVGTNGEIIAVFKTDTLLHTVSPPNCLHLTGLPVCN